METTNPSVLLILGRISDLIIFCNVHHFRLAATLKRFLKDKIFK